MNNKNYVLSATFCAQQSNSTFFTLAFLLLFVIKKSNVGMAVGCILLVLSSR